MYERLLVALDHSDSSERVLTAAKDLAAMSKGEVWVIHLREREVMPRTGLVPTESDDEATAGVTAAVETLTAAGVKGHGGGYDTAFWHAAPYIGDASHRPDAGLVAVC